MKNRANNKNKKAQRTSVINENNSLLRAIFESSQTTIDDTDMQMILTDLTVTQSDVSRKSVTERKEIQIVCEDEDVVQNFEDIFHPDIISQILETYMYGLNVFEVNYKQIDSYYYPLLVQRDFRDFKFNCGELEFNPGGAALQIPKGKVIYALNRANFRKAYGDGLLEKLYFPVKLKNASLKFWFRFLEKFGSPWAIAKTEFDTEGMAKEVSAMLSGDSAVIGTEEEIELIQPSTNIDFNRLTEYCDNQIAKVILGANLTSNVISGSLAASQTHNAIREDLALSDAKILLFVLNRAIKFFKEINSYTKELYVKLYDEDDPKCELAQRDKTIYEMGFRPTKEYIEATYNIEVDKVQNIEVENKELLKGDLMAFKEGLKSLPLDELDKHWEGYNFSDELGLDKILKDSSSVADFYKKLEDNNRYNKLTNLLANSSIFAKVEDK